MLEDVNLADIHGQYRFNFRHPHITPEQSEEFLIRAFLADYHENGPSVFRVIRTMWKGWKNFHNHPDARVRSRINRENATIVNYAAGALWAMERYVDESNLHVKDSIRALREEFAAHLGLKNRLLASVTGPIILASIRREAERLKRGFHVEPKTFIDRKNWVSAPTV